MKPTICRSVWYRSKTGMYTVPATITCTVDTIYLPAVEAGYIPALSDEMNVHLTVESPGLPQCGVNEARIDEDGQVALRSETWSMPPFGMLPPGAVSHNLAGSYQEWDVPFFDPMGKRVSCAPGNIENPNDASFVVQPGGTWTWPYIER